MRVPILRRALGIRLVGIPLVLVLVMLFMGTALADDGGPFSASGGLSQTDPGAPAPGTLSGALVLGAPADLVGLVAAGLEASIPLPPGAGVFVPGLLAPGQEFEGKLSKNKSLTTWEELREADVDIHHNSWTTFDPALLVSPGVALLVGVAWGTFNVSNDDAVTGTYGAVIGGTVTVDPSCPGTGLFVDVSDAGGWVVLPGSAEGDYKQIDPAGGGLLITAEGCLFDESAVFSITGVIVDDNDEDDGDDDDDDDDVGDDDDED